MVEEGLLKGEDSKL